MHPIDGTWEIIAHRPLGNWVILCKIKSNGDTFTGIMKDKKSNKDFEIRNGKINGHRATFDVTMKFGATNMDFNLEAEINPQNNTCRGVATALRMAGTFEGRKISD